MNLEEVYKQVGQWSLENFGDQKGINHIAPMLGICEELGELSEAITTDDNMENVHDAVADICIYVFDFCNRLGFSWNEVCPDDSPVLNLNLTALVGKVAHHTLKYHQGIRGYDNDDYAEAKISASVRDLLNKLNSYYNIEKLTIDTWTSIVSKRNWKKDNE